MRKLFGWFGAVVLGALSAFAGVEPLAVGDVLAFDLPDGRPMTFVLTEETPRAIGGRSFLASSEGYDGVNNVVVVETEDGFRADVRDYRNGTSYSVVESATGLDVQEIRPAARPRTCLPPRTVPASANASQIPRLHAESTAAGPVYVDILVVYEALAATWAKKNGGGITNFAQVAVQKMNAAIANTGLTSDFRFRLVGAEAVAGRAATGYENGETIEAILESYTGGGTLNGFDWSTVKDIRDRVGADLVCILTDTGYDYGVTGTGYSLEPSTASGFAENAVNCCAIRAVAEDHTMTHEVGHNMGAGHSDEMADAESCGPQYYSYSSAYYFYVGSVGYYTIMGYNADGYGNYYTEVPYFSSPDYTYRGVAVGDATHDNTRTLRQTFLRTSRYRSEPPPPDYAIRFIRNEGSGKIQTFSFPYGVKTRLPSLANGLGWARRGYDFLGWATTTANARNGVIWKSDWAYVSTPTDPGKTLTVYAAWALKDGYYELRFNKNDGSGKWRALGYQYGVKTTLPTVANGLEWSVPGKTFVGWATSAANAAAGKVWRTDKGVTATPITAGKTLNLYAIWR